MGVDRVGVHKSHCCTRSCKYGDEDCPVAKGKMLPDYRCEGCTCLKMNPRADLAAQDWWESLTPEQKAELFLYNANDEVEKYYVR